jgi:hypothetical protein
MFQGYEIMSIASAKVPCPIWLVFEEATLTTPNFMDPPHPSLSEAEAVS